MFLILMKPDGKGYHKPREHPLNFGVESWGRYINYVSFPQKDTVELGCLLVCSGTASYILSG